MCYNEKRLCTERNCCPKCGSEIEVSFLYQYSHDYTIGKRGKMLKKYKTRDCGSMEICVARCTNEKCTAHWNADEFSIDSYGYFLDHKYYDFKCAAECPYDRCIGGDCKNHNYCPSCQWFWNCHGILSGCDNPVRKYIKNCKDERK